MGGKKRPTKAESWGFIPGKKNTIKIRTDHSCDMAEVWVNERCVYMGNFWDYYPGCHGITDFDFNSPGGFASGVEVIALREGMEVEVVKEAYTYYE